MRHDGRDEKDDGAQDCADGAQNCPQDDPRYLLTSLFGCHVPYYANQDHEDCATHSAPSGITDPAFNRSEKPARTH